MKTSRLLAIVALLAGLTINLQMTAQDDDLSSAQDPPSRVARLNYATGSVSFQPGGEGDWVEADSNRPLTSGDNLWADKDARAELHVGSTAIRMDAETSLTFLDLGDHSTQLRLSLGSLLLRVRHMEDGEDFEVDTPNLAFNIQEAGEYRIDVNSDGNETVATVWRGHGLATGGGNSYDVAAGQRARFEGADQLRQSVGQIGSSDDFATWAFDRDRQEDGAETEYVSNEVTGYEDLSSQGSWEYVEDYGNVWTPYGVAADWAPYRYGRWVWISPWGWTWVGQEPWGFAPYHYGRWGYVRSRWCWIPGPVAVRPVYSPALVAFVGGNGFHIAVGSGPVGWFPLGPREVYVPPYRVSRRYVDRVNITNTRVNVTQITNVYNIYNSNGRGRVTYVNQRTPAVTVVSRDTFVNARDVRRNQVRVNDREITQAQVEHRLDVQPVRTSVQGSGRTVQTRPPARVIERQVVATRTPAPVRPAFNAQAPAPVRVRTETPRRPVTARTVNEPSRPAQPNVPRETGNRPQPVANDASPRQQAQPGRPERPADMKPVPRPPQSMRVPVNPENRNPDNRPQPQVENRQQAPPQPDLNQDRQNQDRLNQDRQNQMRREQERQQREQQRQTRQQIEQQQQQQREQENRMQRQQPEIQRPAPRPPEQNSQPVVRPTPPPQRPQEQPRMSQPQMQPRPQPPAPVARPQQQERPAPQRPAERPQRSNDDHPKGRVR